MDDKSNRLRYISWVHPDTLELMLDLLDILVQDSTYKIVTPCSTSSRSRGPTQFSLSFSAGCFVRPNRLYLGTLNFEAVVDGQWNHFAPVASHWSRSRLHERHECRVSTPGRWFVDVSSIKMLMSDFELRNSLPWATSSSKPMQPVLDPFTVFCCFKIRLWGVIGCLDEEHNQHDKLKTRHCIFQKVWSLHQCNRKSTGLRTIAPPNE